MKAVIFAGGLGSRLSEATGDRPKPMVEIGGKPILWHIMKSYASHGITEFVVCLGYKGYVIKEYFANYFLHKSDVRFDLASNEMAVLTEKAESWKVTLVDTGEHTGTGGRFNRVREHFESDELVCVTYGDGLTDLNIRETIAFHKAHGALATVTAVRPPGRFGFLSLEGDKVAAFEEKPEGDGGWINGGFFVLKPAVVEYVLGDMDSWESDVLARLVANRELRAFRHRGFWQPMDTLRDKNTLEALWKEGNPPWKSWSND